MKKILTLIMMLVATLGIQAQDSWTVAGVSDLCGSFWDPADTNNDMTSEDGVNYTLVKDSLTLEADIEYSFKVVANHKWGEEYPSSNYLLRVDESGLYTVTFRFDAETKSVGVEAEKIGEAVIPEKIWTIAGETALMGSDWKADDSANDMTKQEDGTFKLVKDSVALTANRGYMFKVVANHSWDINYGADGMADGDNCTLTVEADSIYNVTFTFDPESKALTATAEPIVSEEPIEPVIEVDTWTIAGVTALCGSDWNPADTANDMTMQADSTFVLVKENVTLVANTEYEFKVVGNHTWDINYGADGVAYGANCFFTVEAAGVYTVTFTWNYAKKELLATAERTGDIDFGDHLFVVAGSFNDWNLSEDYKMTLQENGLFTYTIESIQLDKNQAVEYKVVDIVDAENPVWHPEGSNLVFSAEKEGNYSITFAFDALTMQASATGERQVELHEYTAKWVNVERWDSVYAYAWTYNFETYETTFFMGEYPGKLIEKTSTTELYGEEFDVYTCTITSEFPPQNIIFSNGLPGDGNQTTDHAFVDGKVYSEVAPPVEVKMNAFGYMPFSSKLAMLITADMDIKAYYAAGNSSNGELQMVRFFGKAPARYGLFLVGEPNATYSIPTTFNTGGYPTNLMIGSVENTNVAASADGIYRYTFLTDEESAGFYEVGEEGAVSYAGMAYIESPYLFATNDSGEVRWNLFEDIETLGINATKDSTASHDTLFNLQGQRVGKSFRGIAVRNGKKIVVR